MTNAMANRTKKRALSPCGLFDSRNSITDDIMRNKQNGSENTHVNNQYVFNQVSSILKAQNEDEINYYLNEFQKRVWAKYGFSRPISHADPFEIYD